METEIIKKHKIKIGSRDIHLEEDSLINPILELKYLNLCSQLNLSELSEAEDAAEVFLIFCALEE